MNDDGSVVLVGHTYGIWNTTNTGDSDCVAIKLDANGTMEWTWQVNSNANPCATGVQTWQGVAFS